MESRPATNEYDPYYGKYIALVADGDLLKTLERQCIETHALLDSVPTTREEFRYAPGKWSLREVIGHLSDVERIFAYRALRFARGDQTPLSGFDETGYVPAGNFSTRPLNNLVDEYGAVRRGTLALFAGLQPADWTRRGTANGQGISVRALAWIIAGHELHHRNIIQTKYLEMESAGPI